MIFDGLIRGICFVWAGVALLWLIESASGIDLPWYVSFGILLLTYRLFEGGES